MSPNTAKCPLGAKAPPADNHSCKAFALQRKQVRMCALQKPRVLSFSMSFPTPRMKSGESPGGPVSAAML